MLDTFKDKTEEFLTRWKERPEVKAVVVEQNRERFEQWCARTATFAVITAEDLEANQTAARDLAAAREDIDRRQADLDQRRAQYAVDSHAVFVAQTARDQRRSLTQKQCIELAPSCIGIFVAELRILETETLEQIRTSENTNPRTGVLVAESNKMSADARG